MRTLIEQSEHHSPAAHGMGKEIAASKLYSADDCHKLFHHYCQLASRFLSVVPGEQDGHLSKAGSEPVYREVHLVAQPVGVKVQGTKSPFDGNWIYWTKRQGNHPETPPRMAYLLKRQQGKCVRCHLYLKDGDQVEIDHSIPISLGGTDQLVNLQLLHRHCHDQKTATDGSVAARRGSDDSSQIVEEPDETRSLTSGFEAERRG